MLRHICPGFLTFGLVVLLTIDQSSPAFLALAEDSHGAAEVSGITFPLEEVNVTYQTRTLDSACRAFAILDSFDLDASFSDPLSLRDFCLPPGGVSNGVCSVEEDYACCECGGSNGTCKGFGALCEKNIGEDAAIFCKYKFKKAKLVSQTCTCELNENNCPKL